MDLLISQVKHTDDLLLSFFMLFYSFGCFETLHAAKKNFLKSQAAALPFE
jgi:hypothetical protein